MNNTAERWGETGKRQRSGGSMRDEKEGHITWMLKERGAGCSVRENVLAADRPASAAARRLELQRARPSAVLRGSGARVAAAECRRPAGEKLDGRGPRGRRRRRRRRERATPLEGLPAPRGASHRARAAGREATPVGRLRPRDQQQMVPSGCGKVTRSHHLH